MLLSSPSSMGWPDLRFLWSGQVRSVVGSAFGVWSDQVLGSEVCQQCSRSSGHPLHSFRATANACADDIITRPKHQEPSSSTKNLEFSTAFLPTSNNPRKIPSNMADTDTATGQPTQPEPAVPVAIFKKRGAKGKANLRKRPATPPPASSDSDFSSSEDESGQRIKRRKRNTARTGGVTASSRTHNAATSSTKDISRETIFQADRDRALNSSNDATKQSNWFDEGKADDLSAKNLLGSAARKSSSKTGQDDAAPDGIYRGLANQTSYIQKNPDAPNRAVGPIKAPTNIRTITITDMAPDTCKDYVRF